jgi:hypothetical protein
MDFFQRRKNNSTEEGCFSMKDAETIIYPQAQKESFPNVMPYTKTSSTWITGLNT